MNIDKVQQKHINEYQKFLNKKSDSTIVYSGTMRSDVLLKHCFGLINNPISKLLQISNYIDIYQSHNDDFRDKWKTASKDTIIDPERSDTWEYAFYQVLKIRYLMDAIPKEGVFAPFQLTNGSHNTYLIHPGSDRSSYLYLESLRGNYFDVKVFWIWYKDLYPNAKIHEYIKNRVEVDTVEKFFDMFIEKDYQANTFFNIEADIKDEEIHIISDVEDADYYNVISTMTPTTFMTNDVPNYPCDINVQYFSWAPYLDMEVLRNDRTYCDDVYFENDTTFKMGDITFMKVSNTDIPLSYRVQQPTLWIPDWLYEK